MPDLDIISWCGLCEPFSALSHWLGASVFAGLAVHLVMCADQDFARRISLAILGVTTVQMLMISGMYHGCGPGAARSFFLQADVAGIFLLIAGSITPVHIYLFRGPWRWAPLGLAWSVALLGAALKLTVKPNTPGLPGTLLFLMFGWGAVVTAIKLWRKRGWTFIRPAVAAGLIYTVGAVLLMLHQPTLVPGLVGPHEVWHLAVLIALGFHWKFIFQIVAESTAAPAIRLRIPRETPAETLPQRRAA